MFNFFRRKKKERKRRQENEGSAEIPPTHGMVFSTSLLPHFWSESRMDIWKMMEDEEKAEGVAGLWMMASLQVPEQLQRHEMGDFNWALQEHQGWKLAIFRLPPIEFLFDVRYCLTAFGPLESGASGDDAWEAAPWRLFIQQAGIAGLEMKEWRDGELIDHGISTADTVEGFVGDVWQRLGMAGVVSISGFTEMGEEMEAAMEKARGEIDGILARFQAGEFEQFGIKAPVGDGENTEHFWLENVRYEDGTLIGNIDAAPQSVKGVEEGQEIRLAPAEISDYSALKDGKIHGYHTVRVLLPTMPPEQAEQLRAMLADG